MEIGDDCSSWIPTDRTLRASDRGRNGATRGVGGSEGESPVLPSEEDQLSLGEDPNPEPEPTPVAEFPALRITEVLRRPSEPARLSSAHSERTNRCKSYRGQNERNGRCQQDRDCLRESLLERDNPPHGHARDCRITGGRGGLSKSKLSIRSLTAASRDVSARNP